MESLAESQCVICSYKSLPSLVSVHCVESAGDYTDAAYAFFFHVLLECSEPCHSALRRNVSSVEETVYDYILNSVLLGHVDNSLEVLKVAVHAAVGYKAHHMECVSCCCVLHCTEKCRVLKELS